MPIPPSPSPLSPLVYQFASDPMSQLVYRVHSLPESLIDCVQDFGALSEESEKLYVRAIVALG